MQDITVDAAATNFLVIFYVRCVAVRLEQRGVTTRVNHVLTRDQVTCVTGYIRI